MIFLLGVFFSYLSYARSEIQVNNQVEVLPQQPVLLSDIANLNFSANQAEDLATIELYPAMNDGESKRLSNSEVSKQIKEVLSQGEEFKKMKYSLYVPTNVMIKAKSNAISILRIQNSISNVLQSRCGDCQVIIKDIKFPVIHEKISGAACQLQTENLKPTASFLIPYICPSEKDSKTYWISGSARLMKMAPVTLRQLSPGNRITAKDLKLEEVDVTFAKDGIPSMAETEGQLAARYLSINQPVFKSDLKREIAVTRGQLIKAISGNDTFEVSSQVIAEDQGYVGDLIKIKNSDTQKIISGQIIEKGVVRVQ
jgi:flagella basal body P-ring formation protein FlgA